MGVYDRDYYRQPGPRHSVGSLPMWSVTTWLIVSNVAIFILNSLVAGKVLYDGELYRVRPIYELGYFSVETAIFHFQIWRFITFQFLHANLTHILFNMFALYMFGPLVESYLGRWRYLIFYLLCGVAGPLAYIILWALQILVASSAIPMVGASAGIFGVLIAAAHIAPDATVLLYGAIPMRLKTLAWCLVGIALYVIFTSGNNAGGEAGHIGGAVAGFALIRNRKFLSFDFRRRFDRSV
jgi:membrane associated rhomboid family serine protease